MAATRKVVQIAHVKADLTATLRQRFGFDAFRPHQQEVIEAVLAGRSVLAVLPTSAGKSLCYQLPAILLPDLTVVVSPLVALMKDQVDALNRRGIPAVALNSQLTPLEATEALQAIRGGHVKLVYAAPERLLNGELLNLLSQARVSLVAVDEAHCLSQWGHDFRPDYRLVPVFLRRVGSPPVLALTATAPGPVRQEIERELGIDHRVVAPLDRPNLRYGVVSVPTEREQAACLSAWLAAVGEGSVVIYAPTRKATEAWAARLGGRPSGVAAYHAGMEAPARQAVQEAFMAGGARVIVATTAFGMGVDKPDIRAVIHLGLAESIEAYVQEVGRAGRDGAAAWAVTISLLGRDALLRRRLMEGQRPDRPWLARRLAALSETAVGGGFDLIDPNAPLPQPQALLLLPHLLERGIVAEPGHRGDLRSLRVRASLSAQEADAIVQVMERRHAAKMRRFAALVRYMEAFACRRDALADYFSAPRVADRPGVCCDHCHPDAFARAPRPSPRPARSAPRPEPASGSIAAPAAAPLVPPGAGEIAVAALDCEILDRPTGREGRTTRLLVWKGDGAVALHDALGVAPVVAMAAPGPWRWQAAERLLTWGTGEGRLCLRIHGVRWCQRVAGSAAAEAAAASECDRAPAREAAGPGGGDSALREALRQWRREKARERGVPAYVICWDRHLDAIARERPQSQEALGRIAGLPAPTRQAYGHELLALVAAAAGEGVAKA